METCSPSANPPAGSRNPSAASTSVVRDVNWSEGVFELPRDSDLNVGGGRREGVQIPPPPASTQRLYLRVRVRRWLPHEHRGKETGECHTLY